MSTRTVFYGKNKELHKEQAPVQELGPHDVLVKTHAIAFNPTDFKHLDFKLSEGAVLGTDASGEVIKVGSEVSSVKIGDTIASVFGGGNVDKPLDGAYSDVIRTSEYGVLKFPKKLEKSSGNEIPSGVPTTFEQAASLPVGLLTAALAFVGYNDSPLQRDSQKGYALIYGAVSSLGWQAAQLARYLGYDVIAVASKKHKDLLKSIGITLIVDYHEDDWVEQARKIGGDDIVYAYDAISLRPTIKKVFEAVSNTKPVKVNLSLPGTENIAKKPNVEADAPLAYFLGIKVKRLGPAKFEAPNKVIQRRTAIFQSANELLAANQIKALPIEVIGEGIDNIPKGLETIRKGVSALKVVIRV